MNGRPVIIFKNKHKHSIGSANFPFYVGLRKLRNASSPISPRSILYLQISNSNRLDLGGLKFVGLGAFVSNFSKKTLNPAKTTRNVQLLRKVKFFDSKGKQS